MGLDGSLGIQIGSMEKGPLNLITDVPGVLLGHLTLSSGNVQTGVTAVFPHGGNCFEDKLPIGIHIINGFGKSMGLMQAEELGQLETPIILTNTLSTGTAFTALCRYALERNPMIGRETGTVNPMVLECNDGWLNDIRGFHVGESDVLAAMDKPVERFEEGAVGAGRGMVCHGLKGGIGSASRVFDIAGKRYTLGALALTNQGRLADLCVAGRNLGEAALALLDSGWQAPPDKDQGSVIIVAATDLPMSSAQLRRIARRAVAGLSRTGNAIGHGSGEIILCFSTQNRIRHFDQAPLRIVQELNEEWIGLPFHAIAEAAEEAVLSSMFRAKAVEGRDGHRVESLADVWAALPIAASGSPA
ncbi:MAG: P1 family peptidase [Christensenellales bacterium]